MAFCLASLSCLSYRSRVGLSSFLRMIYFIMGIVALFPFFVSCSGGSKTSCRLTLKWNNAPIVKNDSSSLEQGADPLELYISYLTSERETRVDTLRIDTYRGKEKREYEVPTIGDSPLEVSANRDNLYIPLQASAGRKITLSIDWEEPWLYTVKGYEEEELRTRLIRKINKSFRSIAKGGTLQDSVDFYRTAALYIDDHCQNKGVEKLSKEFFPGWQGAKNFIHYTEKDTIARALSYLHSHYAFYRAYRRINYLQGTTAPLLDTLYSLTQRRAEPYDKLFLLELLDTPTKKGAEITRERAYMKRLEADTLAEALFILTFPYNEKSKPTILPYVATSDSIRCASKAKEMRERAKSLRDKRDKLLRQAKQEKATAKGKTKETYSSLLQEADSLSNRAKYFTEKATKYGQKAQAWRKAPRRILLDSYPAGWLRLKEFNRIEQTPYYLVLGRQRQIFYSGLSVDSALFIVDSLLLDINRPLKKGSSQEKTK